MNQKVLKDVGIDVEDALSRMMGNENLFKCMCQDLLMIQHIINY